MVQIVIADDNSLVRQALRNFIGLQPGWLYAVKLLMVTMRSGKRASFSPTL